MFFFLQVWQTLKFFTKWSTVIECRIHPIALRRFTISCWNAGTKILWRDRRSRHFSGNSKTSLLWRVLNTKKRLRIKGHFFAKTILPLYYPILKRGDRCYIDSNHYDLLHWSICDASFLKKYRDFYTRRIMIILWTIDDSMILFNDSFLLFFSLSFLVFSSFFTFSSSPIVSAIKLED